MLFILHKTIDDPLDRYSQQTFWVFLRDKIKILGQNRHYDIDIFRKDIKKDALERREMPISANCQICPLI